MKSYIVRQRPHTGLSKINRLKKRPEGCIYLPKEMIGRSVYIVEIPRYWSKAKIYSHNASITLFGDEK